ncbi:MAG TPA: nitrous oxide reductase accessory protein NosL [Clostridia bacterium]|nr:nitrous oxide reductase accessory protein NosL [Clostridia bacterium]
MIQVRFVLLSALFFVALVVQGADGVPAKPGPKDKCPVCGMFVHKYPDFLAQISFNDGSVAFFDGSKDMFKFLFQLQKYRPKHQQTNITSIFVTDYYSLNPIDGRKAFYVLGSDVYGPMGKELIPFEKEPEAKEFLKDHKGKSLLRFGQITYPIVKGLD